MTKYLSCRFLKAIKRVFISALAKRNVFINVMGFEYMKYREHKVQRSLSNVICRRVGGSAPVCKWDIIC